jgi:tRNA-dihydrouridine synthase
VVDAVGVPVTGNGDVRTVQDARAMRAATGCAAVMIGRGALGRPWIFRGEDVSREERARLIARHCALIEEHLPERLALTQLKKHLSWYAEGRPFSTRMRPALFAATSPAAVYDVFWATW